MNTAATTRRTPRKRDERGFSLVEMIVAVTLFAVVMLVSVGALLSLVNATRKARALESVMNNLNVTLDSMVRSLRMGMGSYNSIRLWKLRRLIAPVYTQLRDPCRRYWWYQRASRAV